MDIGYDYSIDLSFFHRGMVALCFRIFLNFRGEKKVLHLAVMKLAIQVDMARKIIFTKENLSGAHLKNLTRFHVKDSE